LHRFLGLLALFSLVFSGHRADTPADTHTTLKRF
jgi:hypothetical protein